ncbi:MAG: aldehyde ferredoxin oxidoreductase N-terminal domain-containing protein [Eubacteriales bacterium]
MLYKNYIRVLYIDLTNERIRVENRQDLKKYLGGVGVASKLLEENLHPELDPLHQDSPIVFAIGVLSCIFPVITKTVAMFKSPLTKELGESYAGGRMALTMQMAGYDAMVITGKNKRAISLSINTNDVKFNDARAFKGVSTNNIGRLIRERETGAGKRSIIRIGPAGENMVSYASVCVDTYRHFGRLGLGAVFGSKNLKAITITGDKSLPIENPKEYLMAYRKIYDKSTDTELMTKYHDLGTPVNVEPLNVSGGLPTLNLQSNRFIHAGEISGEAFAENHLVRKVACTGCPVGCIHVGQYRIEFDKGYEFEAINVGYDYELIFALGSFLGISKPIEILRLIEAVEETGIDAMSTGVALGWATEALSKGIINIDQTIVSLNFGDVEGYLKGIQYICDRENEFYHDLGLGTAVASKKYGGKDFAMNVAGNEMAGYHTGYGSLIGAAVGARHSHLCNGGYSLDQNAKELTDEKLIEGLFKEEIERCMLNSLTICLFARKVYDRETIIMALKSIGIQDIDNQALDGIGEEIYKTKLRIKSALGFDLSKIELPKRYFETESMNGFLDGDRAKNLIKLFNEKNILLLNK